uniref:Uncharacterized protein n=1 Tax=Arundo donax TaxID=35708 RepID=A0A0A8Z209_ARUDO
MVESCQLISCAHHLHLVKSGHITNCIAQNFRWIIICLYHFNLMLSNLRKPWGSFPLL